MQATAIMVCLSRKTPNRFAGKYSIFFSISTLAALITGLETEQRFFYIAKLEWNEIIKRIVKNISLFLIYRYIKRNDNGRIE